MRAYVRACECVHEWQDFSSEDDVASASRLPSFTVTTPCHLHSGYCLLLRKKKKRDEATLQTRRSISRETHDKLATVRGKGNVYRRTLVKLTYYLRSS